MSISSSAARTATKLTALSRKQAPTPTEAISTPAIPGPTMRDALKTLVLSAIAFGSSARPTSWYTSAWRPGESKTWAIPAKRARTYRCQTWATPDNARAASTIETAIELACVAITSRRLSRRSARTPANRPKSVWGEKRQKVRIPTASGEPVSS